MSENSSLNSGLEKIETGDYQEAFELLIPYAEAGDPVACSKVGVLYQLGLGVQRDIEKAIKFLTTAAEKGNGEAAHNLGTLYLSAEPDFPNEPDKSKFWYKRAKELGFVVAQNDWYE